MVLLVGSVFCKFSFISQIKNETERVTFSHFCLLLDGRYCNHFNITNTKTIKKIVDGTFVIFSKIKDKFGKNNISR